MSRENAEPAERKPDETEKGSDKLPFLPKEFYLRLLDKPACKTTGVCDGCGKCG